MTEELDVLRVLQGDAIEQLRTLPSESVHCCVTSPPYWGLRDYGTAQWEGGDDGCDHSPEKRGGRFSTPVSSKQASNNGSGTASNRDCPCGAKRIDSQLGLEKTPEEYVAKMVEVFREVRRVLRKDGTLWLNLGSSYFGGTPGSGGASPKQVTNAGSFFDGKRPSLSRQRERVLSCDSDDKALPDFHDSDSSCSGLCDECRAAIQNRSRRISGNDQQNEQSRQHDGGKVRDSDHDLESYLNDAVAAQESTNPESFSRPPALCYHCANCGACLNVLASSSRDASLCARKVDCTRRKGEPEQTWRSRMTDMVLSSWAWRYLTTESLKSKDDCAIPWLVCLALRMDGWYSRSPNIWNKLNPMPESVTDRPTKSHEYLFLLTKSANYFYDAEAIKERQITEYSSNDFIPNSRKDLAATAATAATAASRNGRSDQIINGSRNKRSVWTVATAPYPEAHFATYPPDLIKPCILAGTSAKGCCAKCGAPWERVVKTNGQRDWRKDRMVDTGLPGQYHGEGSTKRGRSHECLGLNISTETIGWQPTCECLESLNQGTLNENHVPIVRCTVLDPFAGSGTTGATALELGRKAVLIELNPKYIELIRQRCDVTMGLPLA